MDPENVHMSITPPEQGCSLPEQGSTAKVPAQSPCPTHCPLVRTPSGGTSILEWRSALAQDHPCSTQPCGQPAATGPGYSPAFLDPCRREGVQVRPACGWRCLCCQGRCSMAQSNLSWGNLLSPSLFLLSVLKPHVCWTCYSSSLSSHSTSSDRRDLTFIEHLLFSAH